MDRVAVVINSYRNNDNFLIQAIWSCLQQKHVKVKLIVSTVRDDPAIEIARHMSKDIVLVINKQPGIYSQLNNALCEVKGVDWFTYFSGNDLCFPMKALHEISLCKKHKAGVCYSNFYMCNANLSQRKLKVLRPYNYRQHLDVGNFVSDVALVKADLLHKYKPFKEEYDNYAYYDFWLRIAEAEGSKVFVYNPRAEWLYRVCGSSKHIKRKRNPREQRIYKQIKGLMLAQHRTRRRVR
jgi:hypothetical protein